MAACTNHSNKLTTKWLTIILANDCFKMKPHGLEIRTDVSCGAAYRENGYTYQMMLCCMTLRRVLRREMDVGLKFQVIEWKSTHQYF